MTAEQVAFLLRETLSVARSELETMRDERDLAIQMRDSARTTSAQDLTSRREMRDVLREVCGIARDWAHTQKARDRIGELWERATGESWPPGPLVGDGE